MTRGLGCRRRRLCVAVWRYHRVLLISPEFVDMVRRKQAVFAVRALPTCLVLQFVPRRGGNRDTSTRRR